MPDSGTLNSLQDTYNKYVSAEAVHHKRALEKLQFANVYRVSPIVQMERIYH